MKPVQISDAKKICEQVGASSVILIAIDENTGTFSTTSYGQTREMCARANQVNQKIHNQIASGKFLPHL